MNLKNLMMGLGLAALAASGLGAQEAKTWSAGLSYNLATDSLKSVTNASGAFAGMSADFGWNGNLASSGVPVRISFGLNYLPGKSDEAGMKTSLLGYNLAGEIFINTGVQDLRLTTGISLNKWRAKTEVPSLGINETDNVKGIKFGGRIGLEYQVVPNWSVNLTYSVSELGINAAGTKGLNPGWVMLGAKYHF